VLARQSGGGENRGSEPSRGIVVAGGEADGGVVDGGDTVAAILILYRTG